VHATTCLTHSILSRPGPRGRLFFVAPLGTVLFWLEPISRKGSARPRPVVSWRPQGRHAAPFFRRPPRCSSSFACLISPVGRLRSPALLQHEPSTLRLSWAWPSVNGYSRPALDRNLNGVKSIVLEVCRPARQSVAGSPAHLAAPMEGISPPAPRELGRAGG
jgi:hypothetical protein